MPQNPSSRRRKPRRQAPDEQLRNSSISSSMISPRLVPTLAELLAWGRKGEGRTAAARHGRLLRMSIPPNQTTSWSNWCRLTGDGKRGIGGTAGTTRSWPALQSTPRNGHESTPTLTQFSERNAESRSLWRDSRWWRAHVLTHSAITEGPSSECRRGRYGHGHLRLGARDGGPTGSSRPAHGRTGWDAELDADGLSGQALPLTVSAGWWPPSPPHR